jgi:hypothetical protein
MCKLSEGPIALWAAMHLSGCGPFLPVVLENLEVQGLGQQVAKDPGILSEAGLK